MTAPILRNDVGSAISVTTANAIANNAYANSADKLRIQNTGNALLADFRLTSVTFGSAPVTGALQLIAVDRDAAGNAGPTPSASMLGRVAGTFTPMPAAGNSSTGWVMAINSVALAKDTDYWLYNAGTGVTLNAGAVLAAQCWSPGA